VRTKSSETSRDPRRALRSLCHNFSFAPSGVVFIPPFHPGLAPGAEFLRRFAVNMATMVDFSGDRLATTPIPSGLGSCCLGLPRNLGPELSYAALFDLAQGRLFEHSEARPDPFIISLTMANFLSVAGSNSVYKEPGAKAAGFWGGLWHGIIAPITFVVSLLVNGVSIYETNNNGRWYEFGFMLGMGAYAGNKEARDAARI